MAIIAIFSYHIFWFFKYFVLTVFRIMSTSTDKPSLSFIDRLNTDEVSNLKKHLTQWREKKAQTTNLNGMWLIWIFLPKYDNQGGVHHNFSRFFLVIPPFYVPSVPDNDDGIRSKLREAARNRMNERRNSQLLNSDELNVCDKIMFLIENMISANLVASQQQLYRADCWRGEIYWIR